MIRLLDFLMQKRRGVTIALSVLAAGILLWSITVDTSHAHSWAEKKVPGFWSLFGFISATVLIFFARWFSQSGISREENYYDD